MPVEITSRKKRGNYRFRRAVVVSHVLKMRRQNQAMHGVQFRTGAFALPICREVVHFAADVCANEIAAGQKFAANAIRIRKKDGGTKGKAFVAEGIIFIFKDVLGLGQAWRIENINVAEAGEVGADLQQVHAVSGQNRGAQELRLGAIHWPGAGENDRRLAAHGDEGGLCPCRCVPNGSSARRGIPPEESLDQDGGGENEKEGEGTNSHREDLLRKRLPRNGPETKDRAVSQEGYT